MTDLQIVIVLLVAIAVTWGYLELVDRVRT